MKILIYIEKPDYTNTSLLGSCADIYRQTNYNEIVSDIKKNAKGIKINTGNKVWFQGIVSELSTEDNELTLYDGSETWDVINEKYDAVILSVANLVSQLYKSQIIFLSNEFKKCKIPVYVISIGAQSKSYDEINNLVESVGKETEDFIHTIYETGGEIACRGYYTKEVFNKICVNTAEVVGCPSLFQNGISVSVSNNKVSQSEFAPVINGLIINRDNLFKKYKKSVFIDQDSWFYDSYDLSLYEDVTKTKAVKNIINNHRIEECDWFFDGRLRVFWDIPEWHRFLIESCLNFSIGTRIHGTIMSILSGIPSVLCAIDSRTREMAEFYGIPIISINDYKNTNLYRIYENTDYLEFNNGFNKKFDNFNLFLKKHGLVKSINENNIFWNNPTPIENFKIKELINGLKYAYSREKTIYNGKCFIKKILNKHS